jgi:accessory gene regulator protein AgrB
VYNWNDRAPAYQAQDPEFKFQYWQKKKKKSRIYEFLFTILCILKFLI